MEPELSVYDPAPDGPWEFDLSKIEEVRQLFEPLRGKFPQLAYLIPDKFESYCDLRHSCMVEGVERSWEDAAAQVVEVRSSGDKFSGDRGSLLELLVSRTAARSGIKLRYGSPTQTQASYLTDVLRKFSPDGQVMFMIWEGHGGFSRPGAGCTLAEEGRSAPKKLIPRPSKLKFGKGFDPKYLIVDELQRRHFLGKGTLDEALNSAKRVRKTLPDFMWASDMSWFTASDMDSPATLIGGARALIQALSSIKTLDVEVVSPSTNIGIPPPPRLDL